MKASYSLIVKLICVVLGLSLMKAKFQDKIQDLTKSFSIEGLHDLLRFIHTNRQIITEEDKNSLLAVIESNKKDLSKTYLSYFSKNNDKALNNVVEIVDQNKKSETLQSLFKEIKPSLKLDAEIVNNLNTIVELNLLKDTETFKQSLLIPNYFVFFNEDNMIKNLGFNKITKNDLDDDKKIKSLDSLIEETKNGEKKSKNNERKVFTDKRIKKRKMRFTQVEINPLQTTTTFQNSLPNIQDQPCGNCWAVASAQIITAFLRNRGNNFIGIISPQQVMDCVNPDINPQFTNLGCQGGLRSHVATWITTLGGLVANNNLHLLANYPYHENSLNRINPSYFHNTCLTNLANNASAFQLPHGTVGIYGNTPTNKKLYKYLRNYGPLAVGIRVAEPRKRNFIIRFLFGEEEIIYDDSICGVSPQNGINHSIVLYAYQRNNGNDYWETRNSWGLQANLRFIRKYTARDGDGSCGIKDRILLIM